MLLEFISSLLGKGFLQSNNVQTWLIILIVILISNILFVWMKIRPKNLPPGPIGLPIVGYLPFLGKEPHISLKKLANKYGDIFGLYMGSKYTIILNNCELMKEALSNPAAQERSPELFEHLLAIGFFNRSGDEWVEQRRFAIETARDLGLGKGSWETLIFDEIGSFMSEIETHNGTPIVINEALTSSLSSNIVSLLIGRKLDTRKEKDKIQLCNDYAEVGLAYTGPSNAATLIPGLRKYLQFFKIAGYDWAHKTAQDFNQFLEREILLHKTSPQYKDVPDFINTYLKQIATLESADKKSTKKHYFSEKHLQGSLISLFLGASDTVVSSMGWALRLMAKHQDIQEKIYKELTEVLGEDGRATYREKHMIPYTFAFLMELQRFASIVKLNATRGVSQDFEIKGYTIPKGSEIVSNLWAIHRDPEYWDEPEIFKPERFLSQTGKEILKDIPSYFPFSTGRRNCPGSTFAWMEILIYFSEIIRKFHVTTPSGVEANFEEYNGVVSRLKPQPLCYKKRT